MSRTRKPKKPSLCSIPDCWQPARGPSGLCSACQSWWRRIRYKSATEFTYYIRRFQRTSGRISNYGSR